MFHPVAFNLLFWCFRLRMERVGATGAKQLVLSQAPSYWCFFSGLTGEATRRIKKPESFDVNLMQIWCNLQGRPTNVSRAPCSGYPLQICLQKSPEIAPSDHPCKATSSSGEDPGEGWDLGHLVTLGVLILCRAFFVAEGLICNCKKSPHLNDIFLVCARSGFAAFWHGRGFSAALGLLPFVCTLSLSQSLKLGRRLQQLR